jgi:hypothetical protein
MQRIRGIYSLGDTATNGHESTVRLLLERQADVNAINAKEHSAIYLAVCNGHESAVRLLV